MDTSLEVLGETGPEQDVLPATQKDLVINVDHIAVAVENIDEAVRWYVGKLGFKIVERRLTRGEHTAMLSAVLTAGRAVLVLLQGTSRESQVSRFIEEFGPGVQHIALAVTDLDEALRSVTAVGGAADTPMIEDIGIRQIFLRRDPGSGVRVELIERRGGSFSDASVRCLFRAFEGRELF
ncbi:MAG: VOC family protein [Pseudomonadota bacterium]|nr:VOC family protein [Pseudomonadota bacterium]